jgi:V8-like Glu-specific endopeptidase
MKRALIAASLLVLTLPAAAEEKKSKGTRFWNLTGETITKLELAPAGTTTFGPDQAKNDKDGAVDNDERLKVTDVTDGKYDARLTDKAGRVCMAMGLDVKVDGVFSVEKDQLKDCKP